MEIKGRMEKIKGERIDVYSQNYELRMREEIEYILEEFPRLTDDKGKISALSWRFICSELSKRLFKPFPKLLKLDGGIHNEYDVSKIEYIYYIYKDLCSLYNQVVSIDIFTTLIGSSRDLIYSLLTTERSDIAKTIKADREQLLSDAMRSNPQAFNGHIAILNHEFGWSQPGVTREIKAQALTLGKLPELSAENTPNLPDFSQNSEP